MPIDPSIALGVKPPQIESPLYAKTQVLQAQGLQNTNALAQYTISKAQRQDDETNKLAQLLGSGTVDLSTPEGIAKAYSVAPTMAGTYIKNQIDQRKSLSEIGLNTSKAGASDAEAALKQVGMYRDQAQGVTDPQSAAALVTAMSSDPALKNTPLGRIPLAQSLAQIPQDPAQLDSWKQKFALGAAKYMELNKPAVHTMDTGGTVNLVSTPGLGGAPTTIASAPKTVSPNTAATITKDYNVAGVNPDGTPGGDVESMAQAIAAGKLAPINGFALARPRGQQIMARVTEINPNYDAGDYAAKNAALKDFATGKTGTALRSFNVASDHLDTLGQMADALNNGDMPLLNKVGNFFQKQTGNPAPTNFDAVKDIVGKEVVKAIVAGGGGVGERQELSSLLDKASSPAQLKGVISHFKDLMDAQRHGLLDQYQRTTGRTDGATVFAASPLPGATPAAGAVPALTNAQGWKLHTDAQGNKAYVSPDGKQFQAVK